MQDMTLFVNHSNTLNLSYIFYACALAVYLPFDDKDRYSIIYTNITCDQP